MSCVTSFLEAMKDSISFQEIIAYRDDVDSKVEKDGQHFITATVQSKESVGASL